MKAKKIIFITAGLFVVFGLIISVIAVMLTMRLANQNAREETRTITENISRINVSVDMSDIKIIPDDVSNIILTYFTDDTNKYDISSENGTLSVDYVRMAKDKAKWYDYYFSFDFSRDHDMIIRVPRNFSADFDLSADYGDIEVTGVKGNMLKMYTDYGDAEMTDCNFNRAECNTDYGDIEVNSCAGGEMSLVTACGDIEIENSSGKISCETDLGDIDLKRVSGTDITLVAACGNIEGTIAGNETDYTISTKTSVGKNNLQNRAGGSNTLDVKTDMGSVDIKFVK